MLKYNELIDKLKEIKKKGYVKTSRSGNTGIGKTLEDLLGIKENNIAGPDAKKIEIKSARKNASSMLTLFTKSPLPPKANSILLQRFGYQSKRGNNRKELHTTVNVLDFNIIKGNKGFKVRITEDKIELISVNEEVLGYWDKKTLKDSFERKLPRLIYVKANSKNSGKDEEFLFDEAWDLKGFGFDNFVNLLSEGKISVDIRIGQYPNGNPHDHGTGFRVVPSKLDLCFSDRKRII